MNLHVAVIASVDSSPETPYNIALQAAKSEVILSEQNNNDELEC